LEITDDFIRIKDYQEKIVEKWERMEYQRIPKTLSKYNPAGKRNSGRPQKRW
jgi:predicted SnoaL-like aldol condensation-catalyzing enzyme